MFFLKCVKNLNHLIKIEVLLRVGRETGMICRRPTIIGVGRTAFGEHYEWDPERLMEEAGLKALDSGGVSRKDLDACFFSDYFLQLTNKIGIEEGFLSELLEVNIPMEKARSFSAALSNACLAIMAGHYNTVLVGGVEKMCDRWSKIRDDLMLLEDPWSYYAGGTPEANHELMLREYIKRYNIDGEKRDMLNTALAYIAVKNHRNAINNEYAQFRTELSEKRVIQGRMAKGRLMGRYDFAPISDGATALILTSSEMAKDFGGEGVEVLSFHSATDYITFPSRKDRTCFTATKIAMDKSLRRADIKREEIEIIETYDQSTLMEMVTLEDLGFFRKGEGWERIYESYNEKLPYYIVDGKPLYVNSDGGLKADGNPLGATGGAQIYEVYIQLQGRAGNRQIKFESDRPVGCTLELEGFGTKAYVNLFGRLEY